MAGLYIHIPFCASRCIYCGFYSTTLSVLQDRYVEALCKEMDMRKKYIANKAHTTEINTIYLGGGTPSQLSQANIYRLFNHIYKVYNVNPTAEVTMECNPDDITPSLASFLASCAVNRVSMGAQTFNNARLSFLHRRHDASEIYKALDLLKKNSILNISIDMMFGFPNETIEDWKQDLNCVLSTNVPHISAYSLMYEEGTQLFRLLKEKKVDEISEEASLTMYNTLIDTLTYNGYEHYEISNFAKPGFRAAHNSSYWHNIPYIGIGAAAHSYNGKSRQWNIADIKKYIACIEDGKCCFEKEEIDEATHYNDLITTALRTREGLFLEVLTDKFKKYLLNTAAPLIEEGFLEIRNGYIYITRKGLYISDSIMADLIYI